MYPVLSAREFVPVRFECVPLKLSSAGDTFRYSVATSMYITEQYVYIVFLVETRALRATERSASARVRAGARRYRVGRLEDGAGRVLQWCVRAARSSRLSDDADTRDSRRHRHHRVERRQCLQREQQPQRVRVSFAVRSAPLCCCAVL